MDVDHDSDQSEDLFGDDENYLSVRGSSIQSPEIDASFRSLASTQQYGFSPYKSAIAGPECPSTPCSLGPFLTKAPNWTADLETPEANKARVLPSVAESPCDFNQENISCNSLRLTPTESNIEDVVPVSPIIPKKKRKRHGRRILNNISNVTPKSSLRNNFDNSETSPSVYLSPIAEKSIEDRLRLDDSNRSFSSQSSYPSSSTSGIKSGNSVSPVERVRRLKELQASKNSYLNKDEIIQIADEVFFKDYLALEASKYQFRPQSDLKKPLGKEGFVTFSQFVRDDKDLDAEDHLPDDSFHFDQDLPFSQICKDNQVLNDNPQLPGDNEKSTEVVANVESPDFKGFSPASRQYSQKLLKKHNDFAVEYAHMDFVESDDSFKGFEINEIDDSGVKIAQRYRKFYENYLNDVYPVGKIIRRKNSDKNMDDKYKLVSSLRTDVISTIKTASKKDILVCVKNVVSQEFLLLGDIDEKHDIDLLVESRVESTPVKDNKNKSEDFKNSAVDDFESLELDNDFEEAVSRVESTGFDTFNGNLSKNEQNNNTKCKINLESGFKPVVVTSNSEINSIGKVKFKQPVIKKLPKQSTNVNSCNLNDSIFEDLNFEMPSELSVGFQTGRGKSIKVADNAMLKAKNIMSDDELNKINFEKRDKVNGAKEFTEPVASTSGFQVAWNEKSGFVGRNIFTSRNKSNVRESEKSNIFDEDFGDLPMMGFTTGAGKSIKITESAMTKAQVAFTKDLETEDPESEIIAIKNKKISSEINDSRGSSINPMMVGFQTGAGKSIKVAESAISKAQVAFAKDLETEDPEGEIIAMKSRKIASEDKSLRGPSISPMMMGFQTGAGKSIKVAENAVSRAQVAFSKDLEDENPASKILELKQKKLNQRYSFPGPSTSKSSKSSGSTFGSGGLLIKNSAFINNAHKRKSDDETPAGRKRLCLGLDLQKRKLFNDIEEEDESLRESAMMCEPDPVSSDRNLEGSTLQAERIDTNVNLNSSNTINDEVRASVVALLNDDIDFEAEDTWTEINSVNKQPWSGSLEGSNRDREQDHSKPEKRSKSFPGSVPKSLNPDSIPEDIFFETQFSQENSCNFEDIREQRKTAVFEQERIIEAKKRLKEKPVVGSWLKFKQADKISLARYSSDSAPEYCSFEEMETKGLDPVIMTITSATASTYRFTCAYFRDLRTKISVPVGDGAVLVPDEKNQAGINEFKSSFLASPGVDPSLLPQGWFENHYKWIVWKLASMDRVRFNNSNSCMNNKFLTPEILMKQLKYRYDREIDRSERPALRRITEKDDPPSRRLVLCVSRVIKDTIELTDGWYSIPASVDSAIQAYISSGKLKEGTKLMIQGAELLNLEEGRYPLEITKDVRLKIHTNSTRRARWDTKLGYQRSCGPLTVTLGSVKSNGGAIGKLIVAVSRVYPILYREKTSDGQSIVRNAKCEEKAALAFEAECQKRIEAICSTARSFSDSQASTAKYELETRVRNNLPNRRNVTPILKVKIADGGLSAMLTIWSCNEELLSSLKEDTCISIRNVVAGGRRANELQITAGKSSAFERVPGRITCSPRAFTSIEEASQRGFNPVYGEFDTVGIVVSTGPAPHGMKNYETVNLAFKNRGEDGDDNDNGDSSSYLSILFWENIASNGFAGIATVGSIIACLNLEWRKSTYLSIPTAFCSERTLLTRNPRQPHLRHAFDALSARIRDPISYAAECAKAIQLEVEKKSPKPSHSTPNADKRWSNCWTPDRDNNLVNPDSINKNDLRKSAILNSRDRVRWHEAHESSILYISNSPKINNSLNINVNRSKP
ncbi:GSCOCG00002380001-RA-CDS [Cotesia congregata]|uniref:Similar to BRCA2: Breast cancer type 2 susceptibility protein homolog (Felis catus) n=1 Tax=Cotesia congregata TaxID=51543 RepID=A0A8J2MB07_COTCN|nr:GSCOCG00002380001-RA-CDS [Cotesia congregata]CAG5080794.1 Similar to BRCA2: Breast cancer type 2 susceptibility protein homolog (Felis catus) [Cotesia congregata]